MLAKCNSPNKWRILTLKNQKTKNRLGMKRRLEEPRMERRGEETENERV